MWITMRTHLSCLCQLDCSALHSLTWYGTSRRMKYFHVSDISVSLCMTARNKPAQIRGPPNYQAINSLQVTSCCPLLSRIIPSPVMWQCPKSAFSLCCSSLWRPRHKAQDSHHCFPLPFHQSRWVHKYTTEYCLLPENHWLSAESSPLQPSFLLSQILADFGLSAAQWHAHLFLTAVSSDTLLSVSQRDRVVLFKIMRHWGLKGISAFGSRGKMALLEAWFRCPVSCHWGTSTRDCRPPAAAPKWCGACVCQPEVGIWGNTGKLTHWWCPPLGSWIKALDLVSMTQLHSRHSDIQGQILPLFFKRCYDSVLYLNPDLQRAPPAWSPCRHMGVSFYIHPCCVTQAWDAKSLQLSQETLKETIWLPDFSQKKDVSFFPFPVRRGSVGRDFKSNTPVHFCWRACLECTKPTSECIPSDLLPESEGAVSLLSCLQEALQWRRLTFFSLLWLDTWVPVIDSRCKEAGA